MIGPAIVHILSSTVAITDIVGNVIRPVADEAEGTPSIYYIVEGRPYYNKNGPQTQDWKASLLVIHRNYEDAWQLSMLCKQAFDSYRGKEVGATGIQFIECQCTTLRDDYEFVIEGFGQLIEFDVMTNSLIAV